MTPEQLRQTAAALIAAADGKEWEWQSMMDETWKTPCENIWWYAKNGFAIRPTPEPQMRDWNCTEDVPGPVCWLRSKRQPELEMLVTTVWHVGIGCRDNGNKLYTVAFGWSFDDYEYSTTRRKGDWHPCKVAI